MLPVLRPQADRVVLLQRAWVRQVTTRATRASRMTRSQANARQMSRTSPKSKTNLVFSSRNTLKTSLTGTSPLSHIFPYEASLTQHAL